LQLRFLLAVFLATSLLIFTITDLRHQLNYSATTVRTFEPPQKKFVCFSIILDRDEGYEALRLWLEAINFHNFTFVVAGENATRSYWILNSTRLNFVKSYGTLIPMGAHGYLQVWSLKERESIVDDAYDYWAAHVGYAPKGFFSFQPDTFTNNYLKTKGFSYVQGYCFEQYAVDSMTMRGGWQMPFYADELNGLKPSSSNDAVVILPHVSWDWVASLEVNHNLNTHIGNILDFFRMNETLARDYLERFVESALACSFPFGFVSLQFEFSWVGATAQNFAKDIFKELLSKGYDYYSFENVVNWFKNHYSVTPSYSIEFLSPYSNERVEWFYSTEFRAARIDSRVVSFVNYTRQKPDRYLSSIALLNFSAPGTPQSSIDNSLDFTIDALGGGISRAPIIDSGFVYSGDLSTFPLHYPSESDEATLPLSVILAGVALTAGAITIVLIVCWLLTAKRRKPVSENKV
jgi:hypothetical protein